MSLNRRGRVSPVLCMFLLAHASQTYAQNNVWIGAGAGLWIEHPIPFVPNVHFTAAAASQHVRSGIVAWINANLATIEFHLEANAGIDLGPVEVNVGKAGAWVNACPPFVGGVASASACFDLDGDTFTDIVLWEIPGDVDEMIVTEYSFDLDVRLTRISPAPRVTDEPPEGRINIPCDPDKCDPDTCDPDAGCDPNTACDTGFTCETIGRFPASLLKDVAVPAKEPEFFEIPADALVEGSPPLRSIAQISAVPGEGATGACCRGLNCADLVAGDCADAGGTFSADATCAQAVCQPIPAVSDWGLVVIAALTLVSGTIVLRSSRRRIA